MDNEKAFLRAMQKQPGDESVRLAFADWLEERGDPRGELLRLLNTLTRSIKVRGRKKLENRIRNLVASGVKPVGPFFTNSIGMKFALIWPGTFLMGSPESEEGRGGAYAAEPLDEAQHKVTLTEAYWLAVHPVTQTCWRAVMGKDHNPSDDVGDDLPVEQVSWDDCHDFCRRLSERDARAYRLPTEAEWEYACRAGTTTPFYFGETISADQAHFGAERLGIATVCSFPPNALGLYDMHGNVWEWCADWYGLYPTGDVVNPHGPESGENRVLRGGCFKNQPGIVRSANRSMFVAEYRDPRIGFRPVLSLS
jgi:sulfatase modifying factor 1